MYSAKVKSLVDLCVSANDDENVIRMCYESLFFCCDSSQECAHMVMVYYHIN